MTAVWLFKLSESPWIPVIAPPAGSEKRAAWYVIGETQSEDVKPTYPDEEIDLPVQPGEIVSFNEIGTATVRRAGEKIPTGHVWYTYDSLVAKSRHEALREHYLRLY